jgi:molecular chaperone GrpE
VSDDTGESVGWAGVVERLEELTRELRRQGRAAIAAQAASESCLERLAAFERAMRDEREGRDQASSDERDGGGEGQSEEAGAAREAEARAREVVAWLEALVPVADAIDRAASHAAEVAESARPPLRLRIWPFARKSAVRADLDALASGLRVLRDQLAAALRSRGIYIERRLGVEVDPELHRVVGVRPSEPGERQPQGTVLEVIRPGYAIGRRVVREADVIAAVAAASVESPHERATVAKIRQ